MYAVGDKVKYLPGLPTTVEEAAHEGMCGTIMSAEQRYDSVKGYYTEYAVLMDYDQHVFTGVLECEMEAYLAPARCGCNIVRDGCTCEIGKAELEAERARLKEVA